MSTQPRWRWALFASALFTSTLMAAVAWAAGAKLFARVRIVFFLAVEVGAILAFLWFARRRPPGAAQPRDSQSSGGTSPGSSRPPASGVDRAKRRALLAYIDALGVAPPIPPLVPAAQFFDGNGDDGSIAANLIEHPGVARFAELAAEIGARANVQAVLVAIVDPMTDDDDSWPYSDTLYVLTSESPGAVREWLAELQPDEVDTGFVAGGDPPAGAPPLAPGMTPVRVWWD